MQTYSHTYTHTDTHNLIRGCKIKIYSLQRILSNYRNNRIDILCAIYIVID